MSVYLSIIYLSFLSLSLSLSSILVILDYLMYLHKHIVPCTNIFLTLEQFLEFVTVHGML
jgi:hypothetical protein